MYFKLIRLVMGLALSGMLVVMACNLPAKILPALKPSDLTGTPGKRSTTSVTTVTSLRTGSVKTTLTPNIKETYPGVNTGEASQIPESTQPTSESNPLYPPPLDGETTPSQAGVGVSPTVTTDSYPGPDTEGAQQPEQGVYPGPATELPSNPTSTSTSGSSVSATSTTTQTQSRYSSSTPTFTPTHQVSSTMTLTPTPTRQVPTATPSPTLRPSPTTTPSVTPTATSTSVPFPPWVVSQLQATDPSQVRLASGKVQLIEFFAYWDGTSQAMSPIIHGLEERYSSQMNFIYFDVDDPATDQFKIELGYRKQPHFFLLDDQGQILWQARGYVSVDGLIQVIENGLK